MKIEIKQSILFDMLDNVVKGADKDHDELLIVVDDSGLALATQNTLTKITSFLNADMFNLIQRGRATTVCKTLYELVKRLDHDLIELEIINDKLCVKQKRTKYNFNLIEEKEKENNYIFEKQVSISRLNLVELLSTTMISASMSDTRPILQSVYLSCKDNVLSAVATDSFRLSQNKVDVITNDFGVVIPIKSVADLLKIISGSDVDLYISNDRIKFSFNNINFETRLVAGQFPNVDGLLKDSFAGKALINRQSLLSALERSGVLLERLLTQVVKIDLKGNLATITAIESELGDLTEVVELKELTSDTTFKINYKYLLDALKVFKDVEVYFNFDEPLQPIVITSIDCEKSNIKQLILPIRR